MQPNQQNLSKLRVYALAIAALLALLAYLFTRR
jgi:hypothetical protein